MSSGAFVSQT